MSYDSEQKGYNRITLLIMRSSASAYTVWYMWVEDSGRCCALTHKMSDDEEGKGSVYTVTASTLSEARDPEWVG